MSIYNNTLKSQNRQEGKHWFCLSINSAFLRYLVGVTLTICILAAAITVIVLVANYIY